MSLCIASTSACNISNSTTLYTQKPFTCLNPLTSTRQLRGGSCVVGLQSNHGHLTRAMSEVEPVPPMMFAELPEQQIIQQASWLSNQITCWLDEEWVEQPIHQSLGHAAAKAYLKLRLELNLHEAGDLVLGIAGELLDEDMHDAFVGPFDVANKAVELLMIKEGCDVCCTPENIREDMARYESSNRTT